MAVRTATAEWNGGLPNGNGTVTLGSGLFSGPYTYASRFESGRGTNPEELIGAAHAGCYSMALALALTKAGHPPRRVHTAAKVTIDRVGDGFGITSIHLATEAEVPGIDDQTFQQHAMAAKENCPVSKALTGTRITLDAKLLSRV